MVVGNKAAAFDIPMEHVEEMEKLINNMDETLMIEKATQVYDIQEDNRFG